MALGSAPSRDGCPYKEGGSDTRSWGRVTAEAEVQGASHEPERWGGLRGAQPQHWMSGPAPAEDAPGCGVCPRCSGIRTPQAWGLLSGFAVSSCRCRMPGHHWPPCSEPDTLASHHGPSAWPHPSHPGPGYSPSREHHVSFMSPVPVLLSHTPGLAHAEVEAVLWPRWALSGLARLSQRAASPSQPRSHPSSYRKKLRNSPCSLGLVPTLPPKSDLTESSLNSVILGAS